MPFSVNGTVPECFASLAALPAFYHLGGEIMLQRLITVAVLAAFVTAFAAGCGGSSSGAVAPTANVEKPKERPKSAGGAGSPANVEL
jgi:hypothetical protein